MQLKEAAAHLQQCGITRHQALVFLNLARLGSSTAREVAQAAGVNRVQTYRALDSLLGRGLVEVSLDRPKRYLARPVQEALEIFVEEHRGHLAAAEHVRQALLSSWPNLVTKNSPVVRVQLLKGSSQIYGALRRSVSAARKEVLAFTTTKGVTRSYRQGINEALLQALGRGVAARLIVDIRADNAVLFRKVADRVPVRHVERSEGPLHHHRSGGCDRLSHPGRRGAQGGSGDGAVDEQPRLRAHERQVLRPGLEVGNAGGGSLSLVPWELRRDPSLAGRHSNFRFAPSRAGLCRPGFPGRLSTPEALSGP